MERLNQDVRDALRRALQAALAAVAAYGLAAYFVPAERFLAVISAVLILATHVDETFNQAYSRIQAAAVGSVLALALLGILGISAVYLSLAIVLGAMGAVVAYRPGWNYGSVAAAALTIGAHEALWEVTLSRLLAIAIGVAAGVAAGFLVWPETARERCEKAARRTLKQSSELLKLMVGRAAEGAADEGYERHRDVARSMDSALEISKSMSIKGRGDDDRYQLLVHEIQRLWHSLIILDRIGEERVESAAADGADQDRVKPLREACVDALAYLAHAFEPLSEAREASIRSLLDDVQESIRRDGEQAGTEARRLEERFCFSLRETVDDLLRVSRAIAAVRDRLETRGFKAYP